MVIRWLVPLLALGCAQAQVHPFGPGSFSVAVNAKTPDLARSVAIGEASRFCRDTRGERSLPVEVNLLSTGARWHYVTVVFRCFSPEGPETPKDGSGEELWSKR